MTASQPSFPRRLGSRRSLQSLIPIFPNRFESSVAKDSSDFGGRTFVADLELAGGEFVFAVLVFRRDDAATQVPLPFPFPFYGQTYNTAFVTTNGNLNFLALNTAFSNATPFSRASVSPRPAQATSWSV